MACCAKGDAAAVTRTAEIDKKLEADRKLQEQEVKLLLLGAGQSGKSTVAKQMKIIHQSGFSEDERKLYTPVVASNMVVSMRAILAACAEFGVKTSKSNKEAVARIMDEKNDYYSGTLREGDEMVVDLKKLWADKGVQAMYERRAEYQLNDSAQYYFDAIDRIAGPNYLPTEQDVLRSRAKTTGIIETEFEVDGVKFRMCDVGGQRSERKKWMHCFQDVTACIFCVALSEYNLTLYEDGKTNRMHESLKLFKEICNSKWFVDTAMILFLNKKDLFEEKIKTIDLTCAFPEYKGGCEYTKAVQYIQEKFMSQNENPKKLIYPNITCATDTNQIKIVFASVQDIVLRNAITKSAS